MRPSCRIFLSLLAIIGSLDIGFSFAHAKSSTSPIRTSIIDGPFVSRSKMISTATTTTTRRRPANSINSNVIHKMTSVNGGAATAQNDESYKKTSVLLTSLWGSGGVIYILAKAIKRVLPIAMEPFSEGAVPLSQVQLGYVRCCGALRNILKSCFDLGFCLLENNDAWIAQCKGSEILQLQGIIYPVSSYILRFPFSLFAPAVQNLCCHLSLVCLCRRVQGLSNQIFTPRRPTILNIATRTIQDPPFHLRAPLQYGIVSCYQEA